MLSYVVVAFGWLGHLVVMIGSHNWCYGLNLYKRTSDVSHLAHAVLVLVYPVPVILAFGWDLSGLRAEIPEDWFAMFMTAYLALCLTMLLVWVPFVTVRRALRRDAATVTRSEVVDMSKQLGHKPIGDGHQAFLGRLPWTGIFHVEFVEKTLRLPRLPEAWDGLTILHLSDLHFHGTPAREWYDAIVARCAEWNPDLVAITGDIADSDDHHRWIIPVLGRLKWKVAGFAILGNHDYRHDVRFIRRRLRRIGYRLPENDWFSLDVKGEPLIVIGHEGPWLWPPPDLATCPEKGFRLCLTHTPDNIAWAKANHVDLALAGHVHGGQIRIPPFGPILVPSRYGRTYDSGAHAEGPTLLHVSRGLSGEHPVRYGCVPEVALLTLRRTEAVSS